MSSYLPAKQTTSFKEIGWVRSLQIHNSFFLFKPNYFWIFTITCFNNFSIFWGSKWCIHNSSTPPFSTLFSLVMQTVTKISWYRQNNYLYSNIKPWLHGAYRMQIGRWRCLRKASFCLQFYCWLQCSCFAKKHLQEHCKASMCFAPIILSLVHFTSSNMSSNCQF